MNKIKGNKSITLLLIAAALFALVSCARQTVSESPMGDTKPTVYIKDTGEQAAVKRSAGVTIYGDPVEIKVSVRGSTKTYKQGDKFYDTIRATSERILLRVSTPYGESPVNDFDFTKMADASPAMLQLIYRKEPVFTFLGSTKRILADKNLPGAKGFTTVTFFIPTDAISIKPSTIYDGFYYGNIHMVSTLTNTELLQIIKELK